MQYLIYLGIKVAITATRHSNYVYLVNVKQPGVDANIHAKQERITGSSGEQMNKSGSKSKATPSVEDFKKAANSEKKTPAKVSK